MQDSHPETGSIVRTGSTLYGRDARPSGSTDSCKVHVTSMPWTCGETDAAKACHDGYHVGSLKHSTQLLWAPFWVIDTEPNHNRFVHGRRQSEGFRILRTAVRNARSKLFFEGFFTWRACVIDRAAWRLGMARRAAFAGGCTTISPVSHSAKLQETRFHPHPAKLERYLGTMQPHRRLTKQ